MSKTLGERLADLNIEVGTAMTIDWQQVHIQAAIAAMQGMLSSKETMESITTTIPTRHGIHFITFPFDVQEFNKANLNVEVKKDNPTLLYYPESLEKDLWKKKE